MAQRQHVRHRRHRAGHHLAGRAAAAEEEHRDEDEVAERGRGSAAGTSEPMAHADGDEAGEPGEVPADHAERDRPGAAGRRRRRRRPARRRTDTVPSTTPRRISLPTIAPALTPDARNRRVTPSSRCGRDVHRERDEAEGGEHDADVAGEVVVVGATPPNSGSGTWPNTPASTSTVTSGKPIRPTATIGSRSISRRSVAVSRRAVAQPRRCGGSGGGGMVIAVIGDPPGS